MVKDKVFEENDLRNRPAGLKTPFVKIVVSSLDPKTLLSTGEIVDAFDLSLLKISNNMKNVASLVATHYRKSTFKILGVSKVQYSTVRHITI